MDPQHPEEQRRTGVGLIGDVLSHVSNLVRKEIDLARAEISSNLNQAAVGAGLIVAAVVLFLVALNVLAASVVAMLTEAGLEGWLASLIVFAVIAIIAVALLAKGLRDVKPSNIAPSRTIENVRRDANTLKEPIDG